jgi:hypothetical protein
MYCGAFYIFRSSGGVKIKILQYVFVNALWLTWDFGPFVNERTGIKVPSVSSQVQGDHEVCVHLMITMEKTRKFILNSFNCHDKVVWIRNNRWR